VVEQLQKLISENKVENTVELAGTFCLGQCQQGVCVTVDDDFFSVTPENVIDFFNENILAKL
jgi:NADH:ubiquinone oxidoreductase subunit E